MDAGVGTPGVDRAYGLQLDPQDHPVIVGYTKGNFDGEHAGNTSDDIFVTKYDPSGNREWATQVGTTAADRGYGLAIDSSGSIYAGGYTKGSLGGTHRGRQGRLPAQTRGCRWPADLDSPVRHRR